MRTRVDREGRDPISLSSGSDGASGGCPPFLAESWNAKGPRRFLEAARLSSLRARHARTCQLTSRTWLNSAPCVVSRAPRTPLPLLNSTSTFYFPLPPSFDTFSHVPPLLLSPVRALSCLSSLSFSPVSFSRSRLLPLFLFPSLSLFTRLRFETDVGRKPRSVTRRRRRVTGSPIPYPTPLRDLLARRRNTSEYLLPIRYLLKMPRSRLGNASLPPFPYVRGGKGSSQPLHHFSPYSYSTLFHVRYHRTKFYIRATYLSLSRFFLEPLLSHLLIPFRPL